MLCSFKSILTVLFLSMLWIVASAVDPRDFQQGELDAIWKALWKSTDPGTREPNITPLTEAEVLKTLVGNWHVMLGVAGDEQATVIVRKDRSADMSGVSGKDAWHHRGQWDMAAGKLALFFPHEDLPSFIFSLEGRIFIFYPWAQGMKSELRPVK